MEKDFLKGKRIAITALELENKEHRGIASFIKSSIAILSKYGAEIYLITGFDLDKNFKNNLNLKNENLFFSEVYKFLIKGKDHRELFNSSTKYKFKLILELSRNLFKLFINNYFLKYKVYKINEISKDKWDLNNRIKYLINVKGFISVKNIFHLCRLRSMRLLCQDPILNLNKENINLIISSSPLSLKTQNNKLIQIIHDALPIEITSHPENGWIFRNRLNDAQRNCSCLYVSQESKASVGNHLKIKNIYRNKNDIIYPMPSLEIELLEEAFKITSLRGIDKSFILFNSSIVERKKVENAVNYFLKSNLSDRNFLLCIAGKIHQNDYCYQIKNLCKNHKNILLLDYVSEAEKAWLFLNTSLLISTSSCEGFGIPILDALSLDISSLATSIPSYQEIKNLNKKNKINLVNQNKPKVWIDYLNSLSAFDIKNNYEKRRRIEHFKIFKESLEENYLLKIRNYLN
ncbi:glycosyltransferase family 4 protein [Prochlorococcus marinus XMU1406]|uniref:glycosyltransferase n=1 Tax=Prochlorococcus marinus TaxID=1219 RepID=UPI001ADD0950|nr:glycosyltransferase [Prochlorococcus marinus]MBO8206795.1 glycosyltransferase family 4 protein [Prochlorococcus marinus XMU1406]MCR8542614.1 glycosyltransferase [Prochlorococcus marinus XMU1427]